MHNKIVYYRKRINLSQQGLAKAVGISRQYLSMIEKNKANPSYSIVFKISKVLKQDVNEIFFEDNVKYDEHKLKLNTCFQENPNKIDFNQKEVV